MRESWQGVARESPFWQLAAFSGFFGRRVPTPGRVEELFEQRADSVPLTYPQELLQSAALPRLRRLARRKKWSRTKGDDGRTLVMAPDGALVRQANPRDRRIKALEAHVENLKAQLAAADRRAHAAELAFATLAERLPPLPAPRRPASV